MIADVWTIFSKEWKELFWPGGTLWGGAWSEALIAIGALGIFVPLQVGDAWVSSSVALYWLWLPLLQMTGMIAECVAGERERHTLETLLASRLPDRAILLGKVGAAIAYGWGLTILSLLVGLVTVNAAHGQGQGRLYPAEVAASLAGLSLAGAGLIAGAGVLISLHAPTVRQAYQRLSIALLLVFAPVFSSQYLSPAWKALLVPTEANWPRIIFLLIALLTVLDGCLLAVAMAQFRRVRLVLD
jgi:ABC-2 type transport system permease protein